MNKLAIVWVMMILETGSVAFAIPADWGLSLFDSETFHNIKDNTDVAVVDSAVYQDSSGKYGYTYKIYTDIPAVKLSFFSVAILAGANVLSTDYEASDGITITPTDWTTVGSPVQGVEGLFSGTIQNGHSSVLLWFTSNYAPAPVMGEGSLFGSSVFASGEVHTPVPEPATVFLLGTGGLMMWRARKRIY